MADLVESLAQHRRIGFDTSIFIYQFESSPAYSHLTRAVFDELDQRTFAGITSIVTLMEVCVRPLQLGRPDIADAYWEILNEYAEIGVADVTPTVARRASQLRATYRLLPADALQVGTALRA